MKSKAPVKLIIWTRLCSYLLMFPFMFKTKNVKLDPFVRQDNRQSIFHLGFNCWLCFQIIWLQRSYLIAIKENALKCKMFDLKFKLNNTRIVMTKINDWQIKTVTLINQRKHPITNKNGNSLTQFKTDIIIQPKTSLYFKYFFCYSLCYNMIHCIDW